MVLVFYAATACWLTWPLALNLCTHRPANYGWEHDPLYTTWVLSWGSRMLLDGLRNMGDAPIYYPEPNAAFYGPISLGALPYFALPFLVSGNPVLALNLMYLGSLVLTGATLHLVVHAWTGLHPAGFIAALCFLANRWTIWSFLPSAPHMAVLLYFPLIIALACRALRSWGRIALFAFLVAIQCLTDPVYVAPAVIAPLVVLAFVCLGRRHLRAEGLSLFLAVVIAGLVVLVLHVPHLLVAAQNSELTGQTMWRFARFARIVHDVPGNLLYFMSPLALPSIVFVLIALAGSLVLVRGRRGSPSEAALWRHATLWLVVGIAISLPPTVRWQGQIYSLPHLWLAYDWFPVTRIMRAPERLRVAALMGLALLAGLSFAELARQLGARPVRWRRLLAPGGAAALGFVMYLQYEYGLAQPLVYGRARLPYVVTEAPRDSPVLRVLRELSGPTLEVPVPPQMPLDPVVHATAMYRSIYHRQPLLNGYSSYWPRRFPERMKLAARLPEAGAVRQLYDETGVAYVLVRATEELAADRALERQRQTWLDLAQMGNRRDLELVARDDRLLLFRVKVGDVFF